MGWQEEKEEKRENATILAPAGVNQLAINGCA